MTAKTAPHAAHYHLFYPAYDPDTGALVGTTKDAKAYRTRATANTIADRATNPRNRNYSGGIRPEVKACVDPHCPDNHPQE